MRIASLSVVEAGRRDGVHGVTVHVDTVVHVDGGVLARRGAVATPTTVLGWVVDPAGRPVGAGGGADPVRCPVRFAGAGAGAGADGAGEPLVGLASFDITLPATAHGTHRLVVHAAEAVAGGGAAERELSFALQR